ncbi:hypothetical protein, variant [Aphanomyces invadans]|uniref:Copine C-terminal domain-containing protein n=1 Tax=Aphanomyces invadans TaxID=157072 RepID=A0A024UKG3_9STRA|nr:hypothetical protein, variant [Aphanomyces invadans]ETW06113.1 hypothetical protein, variant [Aphanomyces invadans]|eukprot:XP_008865890.1 hypothetical protein, variant [Aphanomyces invadans]
MGNARSTGRERRKAPIQDNYTSLDDLMKDIRKLNVSANLILGYDFSQSNMHGSSLHDVYDHHPNQYQLATNHIEFATRNIINKNNITAYGFGDVTTGDRNVFEFVSQNRHQTTIPGQTLDTIMARYAALAPHVRLGELSSYAPIILQAVETVIANNFTYHILVIIATGQVTSPHEQAHGHFSKQEQDTINAIQYASTFPLSIVVVGVGGGPWDSMHYFDDGMTDKHFDNVQFVEFDKVTRGVDDVTKRRETFALHLLMELPKQYKIIQKENLHKERRQKHRLSKLRDDRPAKPMVLLPPGPSHRSPPRGGNNNAPHMNAPVHYNKALGHGNQFHHLIDNTHPSTHMDQPTVPNFAQPPPGHATQYAPASAPLYGRPSPAPGSSMDHPWNNAPSPYQANAPADQKPLFYPSVSDIPGAYPSNPYGPSPNGFQNGGFPPPPPDHHAYKQGNVHEQRTHQTANVYHAYPVGHNAAAPGGYGNPGVPANLAYANRTGHGRRNEPAPANNYQGGWIVKESRSVLQTDRNCVLFRRHRRVCSRQLEQLVSIVERTCRSEPIQRRWWQPTAVLGTIHACELPQRGPQRVRCRH